MGFKHTLFSFLKCKQFLISGLGNGFCYVLYCPEDKYLLGDKYDPNTAPLACLQLSSLWKNISLKWFSLAVSLKMSFQKNKNKLTRVLDKLLMHLSKNITDLTFHN